MPLVILLTLLLILSWFFSEVLVLFPLNVLSLLTPPSWLGLATLLFVLLWCFGEWPRD